MYFPQTDTNYGIYPQSPGEGSSWEVTYGLGTDPFGLGGLQSMSGGPPLGAEGIRAAQRAIDSIMAQYGILPEGLPDWVYDVAGGLGQPGGPSEEMNVQFDPVTGLPIYDPTSPVIFERTVQMPEQEVGGGGDGGGAPRRPTTTTTTSGSAASSGDYGGTGTGVRQITLPTGQVINVPENLNPFELLTQGFITREIYEQLAGDGAIPETTPEIVQPTSPVETETGDPLRRPSTDTETSTDTEEPIITDIEQTVTTPEISDVSDLSGGGLRRDMNEEDEIVDDIDTGGDVVTGDVLTDVISEGGSGGAGGAGGTGYGGTGQGGAGGSVNISFGDGSGGQGITPEQALEFFTQLSTIPAFQTGAALESGEVPGIYPTAIGSLPQATSFIQSMLALDRAVSPQQAETALDLYRQITGGVREAQSPLMKSLARRAEMQGVEAERLMGPLSFLEERGATQAGYGQAAALGRTLDPALREQQAGRLREEQRNVNLQLASNLLGQQRATAGLMADIESGIYGRMAPEIGVDPGQILGIAGTDIQNILGEQAARQYSEAIREGARREQQGQLLQTGIGLLPKDFITFGGVEKEGGFTIPGTGITIGGTV